MAEPLTPPGPGKGYFAHASAVIDQPADIGEGTRIWHFCHVMAGARIGARCVLGQNVFVASRAVIGDGCKVQNNVSLYDDVILDARTSTEPPKSGKAPRLAPMRQWCAATRLASTPSSGPVP
jgi:UDP-3-O-[3-hydroxymyristoyl] glucosamine N-acyltransferase